MARSHVIVSLLLVTLLAAPSLTSAATLPSAPLPPVFTFHVAPEMATAGEPIAFTLSPAPPPGVVRVEYGDGAIGDGATPTHAYDAPGLYTAVATWFPARGAPVVLAASLRVLPLLQAPQRDPTHPLARAVASSRLVRAGEPVRFDASGSGAWIAHPTFDASSPVQTPFANPPFLPQGAATLLWAFGDGSQGAGVTADHAFATPGVYPVRLFAFDAARGTSSAFGLTIRVLDASATLPPTTHTTTSATDVTISEAESLDPAYDDETAGGQVLQQAYETLYTYAGPDASKLQPRLASAMPNVSADGLTVTIPLRAGVRFHEGNATMSATDAKFSLDRAVLMGDPDGPAWILGDIAGASAYSASARTAADRATYLATGGVTVLDASTVRIHLDKPDPALLAKLAFTVGSIVSRAYVCAHADTTFIDCLPPPGRTRDPWMDLHEDGTGPFALAGWGQGIGARLTRFAGYWGPAPALRDVLIERQDALAAREAQLRAGDADSAFVPINDLPDITNARGVVTEEHASWTLTALGPNEAFCNGPTSPGFSTCLATWGQFAPRDATGTIDPSFFADVHMRRAWDDAFDRVQFLAVARGGHGKLANGAIPSGMLGYDATLAPTPTNATLASQELALSAHPRGFNVTLAFNAGNVARGIALGILKQDLEALSPDIHVDIVAVDFATQFLPAQRAKGLLLLFPGWAPDYAFPDDYTVPFLTSGGVFAARVGYSSPTVDAMQAALAHETNSTRLDAGYKQLVRAANADTPYIWLDQAANVHVGRDWVHGYYYHPMHAGAPGIGDFSTISKT